MARWFRHPEKKNRWISKEEYFNILFGEDTETHFFWSEETLEYFKELRNQLKVSDFKDEVFNFVKNNCSPEGEETFEDLSNDLLKQTI